MWLSCFFTGRLEGFSLMAFLEFMNHCTCQLAIEFVVNFFGAFWRNPRLRMMHTVSTNTLRNLMSAGGAGVPPVAEAFEDPAGAGVPDFTMLVQAEYDVLVGMAPFMHRNQFPSWADFDAGQVFDQPYWADPVLTTSSGGTLCSNLRSSVGRQA